jgi:hypothetical protein
MVGHLRRENQTSYSEIEFRKLIAGSAAWPPNRNFLYYFLYLWLNLTSLNIKKDTKSEDRVSLLDRLVDSIPANDRGFLSSLTDCVIADQRLDVPVDWENRPYRFFFGDLERPLAFMNKFIADFVPLDEIFREKAGFSPSALLNFSLAHQDILIRKLEELTVGIDSSLSESVTNPTPAFRDLWWQCLQDSWKKAFAGLSPSDCTEVKVWLKEQLTYRDTSGQAQEAYESLTKLFPIVHSDGSYFVPLPQMWLSHLVDVFVEEASKIWPDEPRMEEILSYTTRRRTLHALAGLKHQTPDAGLFADVSLRIGHTCSSELDAILVVDTDKLIVVKSVAGIDSRDLGTKVSDACAKLSSVCELIDKATDSQGLEIVASNGQQTWALKEISNFQVYPLLIINQLTLDAVLANLEKSPINTQVLMLTDLEALAVEIEDVLDLVRFLRAIHEIQNSGVKLIHTDFLDLWAWYRDNGHNFLWSAKGHPNAILVNPHWYSEKEMRDLAEKAAVRRMMITQGIPEWCKFLGTDENTVKLMDPISLIGITVRTSNIPPLIIMVHICSRESDSKDVGTNESLSESLLRRYEDIRNTAKAFVELGPPEVQERLVIWLYGERTLRSSRVLTHLWVYLDANPHECILSKGTLLSNGAIGVAILYRDSLLELMKPDTIEGELLLAKAVLAGIGAAVKAPPELVKSTLEGIRISGKKGISVTGISTGHAWIDPRKPHDRSPAVTAQVTVEIAQMISSLSIRPGIYEGHDARELINYKIFPFLRDSLDKTLKELQFPDAVSWLYTQVENASAHYQIERMRLGSAASALDIEFDLGEAASKVQRLATQIIQAGGLVIERSAMVTPSNEYRMTRETGEHLLGYAIALLELSQASEQDYYGLHNFRIEISDDYAFKLSVTDSILNLTRWQSDAAANDFGRERRFIHQPANHDGGQRFTDSLVELKTIDGEFRNQFGYGLDDILEVMVALSHYPVQPTETHFPLSAANEQDLLGYLTTAIHDFRLEQGKKPLNALCLEADLLREDWRPWLLRGRKHRFATRPLFPLGNSQYIFGPWLVEHSCKVWLAYLFEGLLPLPDNLLSGGIRSALQMFRDRKNRNLEDEVAAIIDKLNLHKIGPRIQRPEELWGCPGGLPVGEIDLLVAVRDTKSLHVLEIKDPARTLVIDDIAGQLKDYYEDKEGFQAKLERKRSFVQNYLPKILSSMGISNGEDWQAKAAFVTRYPVAAAYAKARKYPFLTLRNIDTLKAL